MNDLISLEKIAQWQKLKTLVLDSVSSPITKRVYNMALEEFMAWFQQAPRPGFTKATVSAGGYRSKTAAWARRPSLLECRRSANWPPRLPTTACWRQIGVRGGFPIDVP